MNCRMSKSLTCNSGLELMTCIWMQKTSTTKWGCSWSESFLRGDETSGWAWTSDELWNIKISHLKQQFTWLNKIIEYDPSQARGRLGDKERGFVPPPLRSISVSNPVRPRVPLKLLTKFQREFDNFQDGGPDFYTKEKEKPSGLRPRTFRSKLKLY